MLNDINGYTRTCGLIGNPVEHTLSPVIHNTLSMVLGENLAYVPFHVENGRLEDAVKGAFALNLLGLNVTVPYKSDVIPYLTDIDPLAENIGAVNTLVRTETGYKGYNTDMPGLYRAMCEDGVKVKGEKVLILGAGGPDQYPHHNPRMVLDESVFYQGAAIHANCAMEWLNKHSK